MTTSPVAPLTTAATVWSRVEDGFYVATRDGDFLGYVESQPDGRHLACDLHSRPLGVGDDLPAAMAIVVSPSTGSSAGDAVDGSVDR